MQVVTQHASHRFGQCTRHVRRNTQIKVLLLTQPAEDIAREHGDTPFVRCAVGAATVVSRPDKKTRAAFGHHRLDCFRFQRLSDVIPFVATGHQTGCPVLRGEVGQGPERGAAEVPAAGVGERVQRIAAV